MLWISLNKYPLFGRRALCTGAAIAALCVGSSHGAMAGPDGEIIVGGTISISRTDVTTTVINQTSDRGIIDWRNFDVNTNERVHFNQPSVQSITVNRVKNSTKRSEINGEIKANGNVVILNENGVMFGSNARIDVGGLVASTSDLADDNEFLNGGAVRFKAGSNPNATIENNGTIKVRDAGLVGLVAPHIENNGVITAKFGRVQMAAGDIATVDFAGDGLIQLDISAGATKQIIRQNGVVSADGGQVLLTASTARHVVDSLIETRGHTFANSTTSRGGKIDIFAKKIDIQNGARIQADGATGGGSIRIGGDYQGGGLMVKARETYIAPQTYISANAAINGNGGRVIIWADGLTRFAGWGEAKGGLYGGNGGFAEVSGKAVLDYTGFFDLRAPRGFDGDLLLDPTDITISNGANSNVTGASPYSPNADSVVSNLNVTTLQTALGAANVTVSTRATGAQAGNITVVDPITWASTRTLTLDAHNDIIVNASITGRSITFTAGNDVVLNANLVPNLAANGTLTFQPKTAGNTIGINGGAGILNLDATDLSRITGQWASVVIGSTTNTGAMTVNGLTNFNSSLTLQNNSSITTTAPISMVAGRALTIETNNIALGGNLTGTNALTLRPMANATTVGIGTGAAGTFHLDNTELGYLVNGFSGITIGRTTSTANTEMNTATWNDPVAINAGNSLTVMGAQTMGANALTLQANQIDIQQNITGTGALTIRPNTNTTSVGIGDGTTGTFHLSNAELARLPNGFSSITFGLTSSTAATQLNTYTWNDPLTVWGGNSLTVLGVQTMGNNALALVGDTIDIQQNLSGTNTLTLRPSANAVTMGIGDGTTGTFHLSNAELGRLLNGFSVINIGHTNISSATQINTRTWNDPLNLYGGSGTITVMGAQTMGNNTLLMQANGMVISANLSGTNQLFLMQNSAVTVGIGTGAGGAFQLDDNELNFIQNGFSQINLGNSGQNSAMTIQTARTWNDPILFQTATGNITVNGAQNALNNNMFFRTSADLILNATLSGTAMLQIFPGASTTTVGVAGGAGTLNLSVADLNNIADGFSQIRIGNTGINSTAAVNFNSYTWRDPLRIETDTGTITFGGAQTMNANNLDIVSRGVVTINAALTGTGLLSFIPEATNTTMSVGGTGGNMQILSASLNNITDGWSEIRFGRTDGTAAISFNAARTWNDNVRIQSNTGIPTITTPQNFLSNNFTLEVSSAPVFTSAISGTGIFTLFPLGAGTSIGLAGGAGSANLSFGSLSNLADGWSKLVFGRADGTAIMNINSFTWLDDVEFLSLSGGMNFNGVQNFGANNALINTNSNLNILANLNSTGGALTIYPTSTNGTIGLGSASGAGNLSLDATEISRLNGWDTITIGRTANVGLLTSGTATWNDKVRLVNGGNIALTGTMSTTEGAGTNFVLATIAGNFTNTGGATALDPGAGRYLVYTPNPTSDSYGGLVRPTKRYNKTYVGYGPALVTETGNVYLYSVIPSVSVTINNASRAYGDADPIFTFGHSALFDGDTAAQAFSTASMSTTSLPTSNAGSTHTINGTFLSDMGYNITGVTPGTLTITKRDITAVIGNKTRIYGGVNPTWGLSDVVFSNLANSETSSVLDSVVFTTPSLTATSNAGSSEAITITSFSDNNYNLTTVTDGTLTITKAMLTATAQNTSRAYGDTNPVFTINYTGFANGETSAVIDTLASASAPTAIATSNAGTTHAITPSGAIDNNYDFTYVDATLTITKRDIVAFVGNKNRAYGDVNPVWGIGDITFTNMANSETGSVIDSLILSTPTLTSLANAGSVEAVSITSFSDNNYNLTAAAAGFLTITKRDITAVINNTSRAYGDANPNYTWGDVVWGNLANGETGAVLDAVSITSPGATASSNAGTTHSIFINAFNDDNYNLVAQTPGVLTINKANLSLVVENATRRQGEPNPVFTYLVSGLKNGDVASGIVSGVTITTLAGPSSVAGNYSIDASGGVVGSNYQIVSYVSGELTVTQSNSLPRTVERVVQDAVQVTPVNTGTSKATVKVQEKDAAGKDILVMDDRDIQTMQDGEDRTLDALIIVSKQFLKALDQPMIKEINRMKHNEIIRNRPYAL